jgi:hypothetical protein
VKKFSILACLLFVALALPASAATYNFACFGDVNPVACAGLQTQVVMEVTAVGSDKVKFEFTNSGAVQSSVTELYFFDGDLLETAPAPSISGTGVTFTNNADLKGVPNNFKNAIPKAASVFFNAEGGTGNVSSLDNSPATDMLSIVFTLKPQVDFQTIINALSNPAPGVAKGDLYVGLHVQRLEGTPGSVFMVNTNVVPEPGFYGALALGLSGLYLAVRRRRA